MCNCCSDMCPKCDPGIEAFYQEKVKWAKEMETLGEVSDYEVLIDAKDIWYEYCELKNQNKIDEIFEDEDLSSW